MGFQQRKKYLLHPELHKLIKLHLFGEKKNCFLTFWIKNENKSLHGRESSKNHHSWRRTIRISMIYLIWSTTDLPVLSSYHTFTFNCLFSGVLRASRFLYSTL